MEAKYAIMVIEEKHLDSLTLALLLNQDLQNTFVNKPEARLMAIEVFNQTLGRNFAQLIELNEDEQKLVCAIEVGTIQQFYEHLANLLEGQKFFPGSSTKNISKNVHRISESTTEIFAA